MPKDREEAPGIREAIERSARWLIAQQEKSGGWKALKGDDAASSLNTAEVLLALLDADGVIVNAGAKPIRDGVKFLIAHQLKEGPDRGAWPREKGAVPTPDLVRTSFGVQALIRAGEGVDEEPVSRAVEWLQQARNPDDGWGFRRQGATELMPTCFALLAIIESCKGGRDDCRDAIERGLTVLVERFQQPDGSFGAPGPLQAPHTIYGAMVLQEARRYNLSRYPDQEREALNWLLRHPDQAQRLVEEEFPIGTSSYGFLYMTDSLLLKVLSASPEKRHRRALWPPRPSPASRTSTRPTAASSATGPSPGPPPRRSRP